MARYRLSNIAKEDLISIARWGDERHGIERSHQYRIAAFYCPTTHVSFSLHHLLLSLIQS